MNFVAYELGHFVALRLMNTSALSAFSRLMLRSAAVVFMTAVTVSSAPYRPVLGPLDEGVSYPDLMTYQLALEFSKGHAAFTSPVGEHPMGPSFNQLAQSAGPADVMRDVFVREREIMDRLAVQMETHAQVALYEGKAKLDTAFCARWRADYNAYRLRHVVVALYDNDVDNGYAPPPALRSEAQANKNQALLMRQREMIENRCSNS